MVFLNTLIVCKNVLDVNPVGSQVIYAHDHIYIQIDKLTCYT